MDKTGSYMLRPVDESALKRIADRLSINNGRESVALYVDEVGVLLNAIENAILLKDRCADLSAQNEELRQSKSLSPAEQEAMKKLAVEHNEWSEERIKLSVWLREHKPKEVARGSHIGLSLADTCIMYMAHSIRD